MLVPTTPDVLSSTILALVYVTEPTTEKSARLYDPSNSTPVALYLLPAFRFNAVPAASSVTLWKPVKLTYPAEYFFCNLPLIEKFYRIVQ